MPKTWSTGELATAANLNLLPRVLYRDVLASAAATVTIADADIHGTLADWETIKLTVRGSHDESSNPGAFIGLALRFNGDTAANYFTFREHINGDGSSGLKFNDGDDRIRYGFFGVSSIGLANDSVCVINGHSRSDRRTTVSASGRAILGTGGSNNRKFDTQGQWNVSTVATSLTVGTTTADLFLADTMIMLEGMMRREP